ncbi:MAG: F-box helicase 1-like [Deltaproteobacteria bacterium]|nr:F-box helicase 1-like [Deltaproteobacteria bacterium]
MELKSSKLLDPITTDIVGNRYFNRDQVCAKLFVGAKLSLVREPENIHDSNAIAAYFQNGMCGYVPSKLASSLAGKLDSGKVLEAVVTYVAPSELSIAVRALIYELPQDEQAVPTQGISPFKNGSLSTLLATARDEESKSANYELTDEQREIIGFDLKPGLTLNVIAFAGTGKTTTLLEYSKARPQMRFLYVAFNKSVRAEAQRKFLGNVTCHTSHSLAYQAMGTAYRSKLTNSSLSLQAVKSALGLDTYLQAKTVVATLQNFLVSGDPDLGQNHIQWPPATDRSNQDFYIDKAKELWSAMRDPNNRKISMLHDGYLKLFQLSMPQLEYDCILLDEAQDTNPVVADMILSQSCAKILVGDPHQQIYAFRGARDVMQKMEADATLYLTYSFRFGQEIASLANAVLRNFKGEKNELKGVGPLTGPSDREDHAIVARTNATLFDKAVTLSDSSKIAFLGGIEGYRFDEICDVYKLYSGNIQQIVDPTIRSFQSFSALKKYADEAEDSQMNAVCRVVVKYGHSIPRLVEKIRNAAVDREQADFVLATAHKAKGAEFSKTRICDDFNEFVKGGKPVKPSDIGADEVNLLYVTVTRAKNSIDFDAPNKWEALIRSTNMPGQQKALEFFSFRDFGEHTSEHAVSMPAYCMKGEEVAPVDFSVLCHKYHSSMKDFWAKRVVHDSVLLGPETLIRGVDASEFIHKNCFKRIVLLDGRLIAEVDILSFVTTGNLELFSQFQQQVMTKYPTENRWLTDFVKLLSGDFQNVDIRDFPDPVIRVVAPLMASVMGDVKGEISRNIWKACRAYTDSERSTCWNMVKEVTTVREQLGTRIEPLLDLSMLALIYNYIFRDKQAALDSLSLAEAWGEWFQFSEGMLRIDSSHLCRRIEEDSCRIEKQVKETSLEGPLGSLPRYTLGMAKAFRILADNQEAARSLLRSAVTFSEKAGSPFDLVDCACEWLRLFDDMESAVSCAKKAEEMALEPDIQKSRVCRWLPELAWDYISKGWQKLGHLEKAQRCMKANQS